MVKKILFLFVVTLVLYACASVPVTGRKQLSLVSNAEIIPMVNQQYAEVVKKGPLSTNREQTEMVNRVGVRFKKPSNSTWLLKPFVMNCWLSMGI